VSHFYEGSPEACAPSGDLEVVDTVHMFQSTSAHCSFWAFRLGHRCHCPIDLVCSPPPLVLCQCLETCRAVWLSVSVGLVHGLTISTVRYLTGAMPCNHVTQSPSCQTDPTVWHQLWPPIISSTDQGVK
jgi:hypothetical protein